MADRGYWPRYEHNDEGIWHAIDDIREVLVSPRELQHLWARVATLELAVAQMHNADEVAAKVREQLSSHRLLGFTVFQKTMAGLVAGIVAAGSILQLVQGATGH